MARRAQQCMASSMLPQEKSEQADNRFYSTSRNQVLTNAVHCARGCFVAAARKVQRALVRAFFQSSVAKPVYLCARGSKLGY